VNRWQRLAAEYRAYPLWLRLLLPLAAGVFIGTLITLVLMFPDNPIYLKDGGFVGKYGAARTAADYACFTVLNRVLLASGLALFAALLGTVVFSGDKGGGN